MLFVVLLALLFLANCGTAQTISTYAAGIGDGLSATTYGRLFGPTGVSVDTSGNVLIIDNGWSNDYMFRLRSVTPAGIITTIAGTSYEYAALGLGGPAIYAGIGWPEGVTNDAAGNTYVSFSNTICKINSLGINSLITGDSTILGVGGFSGDGSAASAATVNNPIGIAVDATGNIYIADQNNNRIRMINTSGIINTIAGGGMSGLGDGGTAISAGLNNPTGVAVDALGNIYIADNNDGRIRKVNSSGIISTFAGTGSGGFSGAGGPATAAGIGKPYDIKVDAAGNVYFSTDQQRVCKVNSSGILSVIAGNGTSGFSGDGGSALSAELHNPEGISLDATGNIYVADYDNKRIRKVSTSGIINTIAGNGLAASGFLGDGGSSMLAEFNGVDGLWLDPSGNLYAADAANQRVRKISTSNVVTTYAGNGISGFAGDGGAATAAELEIPYGGIIDRFGNMYIADEGTSHIRKIAPSGIISTVAGGGTGGLGDGLPATAAEITAYQVGVDSTGNIYIADHGNYRIRKVDISTGIISTIAGTGVSGHTGDGGAATAAEIYAPTDVKVDQRGDIYIADGFLRMIDSAGIISTLPVGAQHITIDRTGNVYCENGNSVSRYDIYGYVSLLPGKGIQGYVGEGIAASAAEFMSISGIAIDTSGNLYISDNSTTIRKICCISNIIDHPPVFTHSAIQSFTVCASSSATNIDTFLTISDQDTGSTETWTITAPPAHGTLSGFSYSMLSTGGAITPAGLNYTPTVGYSGTDHFIVRISDGTDTAITSITVTIGAPPALGTISGTSTVCAGATITLNETTAGGSWSSTNTAIATTDSTGPTTAAVIGASPGVDTILYSKSSSCGIATASFTVTVNVAPAPITGTPSLCAGAINLLADAIAGGTWSSSNVLLATVSGSGTITGVATGTPIITYAIGSCRATLPVTVEALPVSGTITGATSVCVGSVITLYDAVAGGAWSASNGNATIAGGIITGVSAGMDTMSYSVTNICGMAVASYSLNINPLPTAGVITGLTSVCTSDAIVLADTASGGIWSSISGYVSVGSASGVVAGIAAGTAVISYAVTNSCGTAIATATVTVDIPGYAGAITGSSILCAGDSLTLTDTVSGGTWSSATPAVLSVSSGGVVTGLATGTGIIYYTVTNACGTAEAFTIVNVYASTPIDGITGPGTVCTGSTITLADASAGGTWSSAEPASCTISGSGVITGATTGVATISYTASLGCGVSVATAEITVNAAPYAGVISGASALCIGADALLSSTVGGGIWACTNGIATITPTGMITGITAGIDTVLYKLTNSCGTTSATYVINVYAMPSAGVITGHDSVCTGATAVLTDSVAGGVWSSSNATIASVNPIGVVTGAGTGTTSISYTVSNICGTVSSTVAVTVLPAPDARAITGADNVCVGGVITLSDPATGGNWQSASSYVAAVYSTSGVVTGISEGIDEISYTVSNSCGTSSVAASITVNPLPAIGAITGFTTVTLGGTTTLVDVVAGGTWSSGSPAIATVSATGVVTGVDTGIAIITYTMENIYGCTADTTIVVSVQIRTGIATVTMPGNFTLSPNPANEAITIAWANLQPCSLRVVITDLLGQEAMKQAIEVHSAQGSVLLKVPDNLPSGNYIITIVSSQIDYTGKLTLER